MRCVLWHLSTSVTCSVPESSQSRVQEWWDTAHFHTCSKSANNRRVSAIAGYEEQITKWHNWDQYSKHVLNDTFVYFNSSFPFCTLTIQKGNLLQKRVSMNKTWTNCYNFPLDHLFWMQNFHYEMMGLNSCILQCSPSQLLHHLALVPAVAKNPFSHIRDMCIFWITQPLNPITKGDSHNLNS